MPAQDQCCTIFPYLKVPPDKMETVRTFCEEFVGMTKSEPDCRYYGFSFAADQLHCREGYKNAEALLAHVANVGEKLGEPLAAFNAQFFTLEYGFRR